MFGGCGERGNYHSKRLAVILIAEDFYDIRYNSPNIFVRNLQAMVFKICIKIRTQNDEESTGILLRLLN